jgi:hypothetical protein
MGMGKHGLGGGEPSPGLLETKAMAENEERDLTRNEEHILCTAFAERLGYLSWYTGGELLWRDSSGRPNILSPLIYQHRHQKTDRWCPAFIRLTINVSEPSDFRREFWRSGEPLDRNGPNAGLEITVLADEAKALVAWLPSWLRKRELRLVVPLPDPPVGVKQLLNCGERRNLWSDRADETYLAWQNENAFAEAEK